MKKTAVLIVFILLISASFAQPANDEPCNAIVLPIIESADGCTPVVYNITGASFSNVPGTLSCSNSPDVWFRFNTPDPFMKLRFGGTNVTFTTYTFTSCSSNLQDQLGCLDSATWASSGNNIAFFANTDHLIRVQSINGSSNFSFSICLTLLRAGADQRVGINTKFPQANLDVAGKAVFRDTLSISNVLRFNNGTQASNRILRSDANGYAFWSDAPVNYWTATGNHVYNNNSGNVGIGTVTPTFPLSFGNSLGNKIGLFGTTSSHYGLGVQDNLFQLYADGSSSNIAFGHGSSVNFAERMRIINSGADGLSLNGRIILRNGTSPLNLAAGPGVWLYNPDNTGLLGFMGTQNNQNIGFFGGPAGWGFTYNALNSWVGIGNNNPNAPLSFPATLGKKITLFPGAAGDVGFGVTNNRLQIFTDYPGAHVAIGYGTSSNFTERARFVNEGVDGLSMKGRLVIGNGLASDNNPGIMILTRDNTALNSFIGLSGDDILGMYSYRGAGWGIAMNTINGNVGIGTFAPTQKLHVNGNILASGTITPSDIRYKKNIQPIAEPLTKLLQVNGVTYNMKSESFPDWRFENGLQYGVIAQDVEKVFPEIIQTVDANGYKGVEYMKLIPVLIEAIKEQQKQIDELKSKVESLKNSKAHSSKTNQNDKKP